jgi:hypothetical protein
MHTRTERKSGLWGIVGMALVAITASPVFALITGGAGNEPIRDPGWPKGAAAVFNVTSRVAWWEGPPFGGGEWHAECRGDAKALSTVLANFAKLEVKSKRIVLHNGVGKSFWLGINKDPVKKTDDRMDWSFTVWQPENWKQLRKLPADLNPTGAADAQNGPPAQIDVYTDGALKWADVIVPPGLTIDDQRLEGHGFTSVDGVVLEGHVVDAATKKPVGARVRLEKIEPNPKGGYQYSTVANANADALGRWVLKDGRAGWFRIVVDADGYVPRVIGYIKTDGQPHWEQHDGALVRPAVVAGLVTDDAGQPLANVDIRLGDIAVAGGGRYETLERPNPKTDASGKFRIDNVPAGKATVWIYKEGYCRPGLGQAITTPHEDIKLTMIRSGRIVVTVDFTGKERPADYIVNLEPEGGNVVGSFGGSGQINAQNQKIFENVPPAKYLISGRPNPGSLPQQTETIKVDVKGGATTEIKLEAR